MPDIPQNEDLDPERLEPVFDYLRKHSGHSSLATLRGELLKYGYDRATVDRAIAVHQEQNPPKPPASVWPKVLLVVAFNAVIMALIGWASREGEYGFIPAVVVYGFLICCVELVVFFSLRAASGTRHWGHALLQGLALFVGLAVVVLGGLCFAGP